MNPPRLEPEAARAPAFGPWISSIKYGTSIAHASNVQLVVWIMAISEELLNAKIPLPAVQSITTMRHVQPESSFLNTSCPRLPLAICSTADAVESDAETIASAKSCCPNAGSKRLTKVGMTVSGLAIFPPRISLERALAKYAPPTITESANIASGAAFLVSAWLFRAKWRWISCGWAQMPIEVTIVRKITLSPGAPELKDMNPLLAAGLLVDDVGVPDLVVEGLGGRNRTWRLSRGMAATGAKTGWPFRQPGTHSPAAWPKKRQGSRAWSSMSKMRIMSGNRPKSLVAPGPLVTSVTPTRH